MSANNNKLASSQKTSMSKNFPYDLTIGMIFRNDIKYIKNCLETMKPLREFLKVQLIMTDTGSTDGSREVAEAYADLILEFQWCDDFSAARNTGIERAEGRWFVYFDCDHDFDDTISHLVSFLKNPENDTKHSSVNLTIIDYIKKGDAIITKHNERPLLINFTKGKNYFVYPIHETIPVPPPKLSLPMNVFHWGYFDNIHLKHARNIPILEKIIASEPKELKHYLQLVSEVSTDAQRIGILRQGLQRTVGIKSQDTLQQVALVTLYSCALRERDFPLLAETERILNKLSLPLGISLEYYGYQTEKALIEQKPEQALVLFLKFKNYYEKNQKTPDSNTFMQGFFFYKQASTIHDLEAKLIKAFTEQNQEDKAIQLLRQSTSYLFQFEENNHYYFPTAFQTAFTLGDYLTVEKYYRFLVENQKEQLLPQCQKYLEEQIPTLATNQKEQLFRHFTPEPIDAYTALWILRQNNFNHSSCSSSVSTFLQNDPKVKESPLYQDLIYHYLSTKQDHYGFIENSPLRHLVNMGTAILKKHENALELLSERLQDPSYLQNISLKEKGVLGSLGHLAIQLWSHKQNKLQTITHFPLVTSLMYSYLTAVYQASLLSPAGKSILSPEEYFTVLSMNSLNLKENPVAYIKSLREILSLYPNQKELILILVDDATNLILHPNTTGRIENKPSKEENLDSHAVTSISLEPLPTETKQTEPSLTEEIQTETNHTEEIQTESHHTEEIQTESHHTEEIQTETSPTEAVLSEPSPSELPPTSQEHSEETQNQELDSLRQKVKTAINQLLDDGNLSKATLFLEKYKASNPTDPDIPSLEKRCLEAN